MIGSGNKSDAGMVSDVKPVDKPPDLIHSCLGRGKTVSVKPMVEIHTSGVDTRYKFVCDDVTVDQGGTPSHEIPRCDSATPVKNNNKPIFVDPRVDPENDITQSMVTPACDGLHIEVDANPVVSWNDPSNDVTQLLDEGVSGDDLVIQVEVDDDRGVDGSIIDSKVNPSYGVPKVEVEQVSLPIEEWLVV